MPRGKQGTQSEKLLRPMRAAQKTSKNFHQNSNFGKSSFPPLVNYVEEISCRQRLRGRPLTEPQPHRATACTSPSPSSYALLENFYHPWKTRETQRAGLPGANCSPEMGSFQRKPTLRVLLEKSTKIQGVHTWALKPDRLGSNPGYATSSSMALASSLAEWE